MSKRKIVFASIVLCIAGVAGIAALFRVVKRDFMGENPKRYWSDPRVIALARAIRAGDSRRIAELVAEGADVNARGEDYMSPLVWCAGEDNNKAAFEQLLALGADPSLRYKHFGSVTFFFASSRRDADWLRMCLKHGADPNYVVPGFDQTPIFGAINSRRKENFDVLIEAGADINHQTDVGDTPLLFAAGRNWFDTVYYLLELGADYTLKTIHVEGLDAKGRQIGSYDLAYEIIDTTVSPDHELARWREKVIDWLDNRGYSFEEAEKRVAVDSPEAYARWQREQMERKMRRGR